MEEVFMYSYNQLSWHLLKKLPPPEAGVSPHSSAHKQEGGATWVTALCLWYNHAHCAESPSASLQAGFLSAPSGRCTSGGHSRREEMYILLLGSLWDAARILIVVIS